MLSAADFVALQVQALPQPQALLQSQRSPQLQRSVAPISHPHDSSLHRHSLWIWFGIALSWFVARSSALSDRQTQTRLRHYTPALGIAAGAPIRGVWEGFAGA